MPDCWSVSYVRFREWAEGSTVSLHQLNCVFITVNGHSISEMHQVYTGRSSCQAGNQAVTGPALACNKPAAGLPVPCCLLGSRYPDPRRNPSVRAYLAPRTRSPRAVEKDQTRTLQPADPAMGREGSLMCLLEAQCGGHILLGYGFVSTGYLSLTYPG